jgi:hypothetical protein
LGDALDIAIDAIDFRVICPTSRAALSVMAFNTGWMSVGELLVARSEREMSQSAFSACCYART